MGAATGLVIVSVKLAWNVAAVTVRVKVACACTVPPPPQGTVMADDVRGVIDCVQAYVRDVCRFGWSSVNAGLTSQSMMASVAVACFV